MSFTSLINNFQFQTSKKKSWRESCGLVLHPFALNGHFSYAFIYGSWEVIRARKVGTTHTTVDYVVYRLFFPVMLLGACLFGVVQEENLGRFFSLMEVWSMVLMIAYAFIFLQNCLENNLHRENVKHRQVIPERLIVTDEIEKGGHKFYICKRSSILPTDRLYTRESLLYLLFNIVVTCNVAHLVSYFTEISRVPDEYMHNEELVRMRLTTFGGLALAEVFLTPIPMRMAHVIYPLLYYGIYLTFTYFLYDNHGIVLYEHLDWGDTNQPISREIALRFAGLALTHFILTLLCGLRDFVISLLDNSRAPKQIKSLRAQKRLARRKIMNYIEGADGRIIGISLEKHLYAPVFHEVIQTDKNRNFKTNQGKPDEVEQLEESESSTSTSDEEGSKLGEAAGPPDDINAIPLNTKAKPPPAPRYKTRYVKELRISSSSSDEEFRKHREMVDIQNIRFPTPPAQAHTHHHGRTSKKSRDSKIPVPLNKLGLQVKTRDSKENIHHKLDNVDSPPTPPFIKLVQTMVRLHKETRKEVEQYKKKHAYLKNQRSPSLLPQEYAYVKVVRAAEEHMTEDEIGRLHDPEYYRKKLTKKKRRSSGKDKPLVPSSDHAHVSASTAGIISSGNKPRGSKVLNVGSLETKDAKRRKIDMGPEPVQPDKGFYGELTKRLEDVKKRSTLPKEEKKKSGADQQQGKISQGLGLMEGITEEAQLDAMPKGILKGERRESEVRRREARLLKRRHERTKQGKHGQPVYDPLRVPDIEQETSFHFLGAKLKRAETATQKHPTLVKEDLALFQKHPGFSTLDHVDLEKSTRKSGHASSLVAFHPVVRYFNLNEKENAQDPLTLAPDKKINNDGRKKTN